MLRCSALVVLLVGSLLGQPGGPVRDESPTLSSAVQRDTQRCAENDSAAASAVRARLNEWVRQANAGDQAGMSEVWAPKLVGWFPSAGVFTDSAASAVAGLPSGSQRIRPTYEIVIDDIVASGSIVVVHDLWTESRQLSPTKLVTRRIRGSELWRCQPDGRWRIARYVSAPEPWVARTAP